MLGHTELGHYKLCNHWGTARENCNIYNLWQTASEKLGHSTVVNTLRKRYYCILRSLTHCIKEITRYTIVDTRCWGNNSILQPLTRCVVERSIPLSWIRCVEELFDGSHCSVFKGGLGARNDIHGLDKAPFASEIREDGGSDISL